MFTKGQIVRLKPNSQTSRAADTYLAQYEGRNLTVSSSESGYISFAEDTKYSNHIGAWDGERFEAVPNANPVSPNKQLSVSAGSDSPVARGKNGKFASRRVAPTILRNGSLYNVSRKSKGKRVLQVARLKVLTKDGKSAVMSRHGKLFFAKPAALTLAPQSDVTAYLTEAKPSK